MAPTRSASAGPFAASTPALTVSGTPGPLTDGYHRGLGLTAAVPLTGRAGYGRAASSSLTGLRRPV